MVELDDVVLHSLFLSWSMAFFLNPGSEDNEAMAGAQLLVAGDFAESDEKDELLLLSSSSSDDFEEWWALACVKNDTTFWTS